MIGKYLEKLRKERKLSQKDIADKLGVSRPTYVQIENNKRELLLSEAKKLANIFDISFDDFIKEKIPAYPKIDIKKEKKEKRPLKTIARISVPQKKVKKFKEILLYILEKSGAKPNVGMTVIYKLLYFIDFDFYEKFEEQIIGATYIKNHYGPTPVEFKSIVDQMNKNKEIETIKSKYYNHPQTKYLPLRNADLSILTGSEKDHIDDVLARLGNKNATELTDYSHKDVPWITAEDGGVIDYEAVFYRTNLTSVRKYDEN